jgi:hypothetical protein
VSDIFREVEEEVRRERLDKLWKQYGDYIVAAACLLVIGAAGIQLWRTYDQRERLKAADQYAAAEQMMEGGQNAQAADAFGRLADTAPSGYKELARLQHADALLASGERGDALGLYKQIATGSDPILSAVARVRSAWATVDYASRADVTETLGPLMEPSSPWNPMAQEILAYWDYRSGNSAAAQSEYSAISHDMKAPASLRERAAFMTTFLKAGGDKDYGTVPQPPKPAANTPQQLVDPGAATLPNTPGTP